MEKTREEYENFIFEMLERSGKRANTLDEIKEIVKEEVQKEGQKLTEKIIETKSSEDIIRLIKKSRKKGDEKSTNYFEEILKSNY